MYKYMTLLINATRQYSEEIGRINISLLANPLKKDERE